MASPKKPNGSPIQAGTLNGHANASRPVIPTLPSFVSSRSQHASDAGLGGAAGRLKSWEHLPTDKLIQRGAETTAKANARSRALAQFAVGALLAVGFAMLSVAFHREAQLERLQPQVEQLA